MVAIYIAGFVIFFAVAAVVYKAATRLVIKSRVQPSVRKLPHPSFADSHILLGPSPRLSRSDLLLENLALRQELSVLRALNIELQKGTPENGERLGLGSVALARPKASPDHRHDGDGRSS